MSDSYWNKDGVTSDEREAWVTKLVELADAHREAALRCADPDSSPEDEDATMFNTMHALLRHAYNEGKAP